MEWGGKAVPGEWRCSRYQNVCFREITENGGVGLGSLGCTHPLPHTWAGDRVDSANTVPFPSLSSPTKHCPFPRPMPTLSTFPFPYLLLFLPVHRRQFWAPWHWKGCTSTLTASEALLRTPEMSHTDYFYAQVIF